MSENQQEYQEDWEWLIADDLLGMRLNTITGAAPRVLLYSHNAGASAVLIIDNKNMILTNGKFVDFGDEYPVILGMIDYVQASIPHTWMIMPVEDTAEEMLAEWAATQPADNYVYLMSCGHEFDASTPRQPGDTAYCSMHGNTTITGPKEVTG